MAVIHTYPTDTNISNNDLLIGADGDNQNITKKFTLQAISDFIVAGDGGITNTNYYLDGVTANSADGVITFSMTGQTDITLDLGTSIFKDTSFFAAASHTHSLSDIISANDITSTYLNVSGNGTSGQILTSNGSGGFNWINQSAITDNNFYLDGISQSGNILTFSVNGGTNQTFTFGAAAFLSVADVIAQVQAGISIPDIIGDFGNLADLDVVGSNEIANKSVITAKILDNNVTEAKLKVSNSPTSGYVLTSDGTTGFTWASNSASNYYLDSITKSSNTLTFNMTGGLDSSNYATYTFGGAAFKDVATTTGRESTKVPPANHTHSLAHITDSGSLASLNEVTNAVLGTSVVHADNLQPDTVGSDGQVLSIDSSGDLKWVTLSATSVNFLTLPDSPSSYGTAGQIIKINTAADGLEFSNLEVGRTNIQTTNTGTSGKVLAVDSNNALEWIDASSLTQVGTDEIVNGAVTFAKLNDEFKTSAASVTLSSSTTSTALNFSSSAVFNVQLAADATNTSITISNPTIGMTKMALVTGKGGTGTLTLPGTRLSGTLDQTNNTVNYIQWSVVGSSTYVYTISQAAS